MENLKPPGEMDFSTTGARDVAETWRKWKQTMELYLQLCLAKKSEKEKCSTFLYIIGQAGRDIFNAMTLQDNERDKISVLFAKFEEYCRPKQNVTIERYRFNSRAQGKFETVDQYVTELKLIAKNCSFGDLESQLIRDRVVCGIHSDEVRQHLLRVDELTLDKCLKVCRAYEQTKKSVEILTDNPHMAVDDLKKQKSKRMGQTRSDKQPDGESQPKYICNNCGKQHAKRQCPAYGQKCHKCGKLNHFAKYCRSKRTVQSVGSQKPEDADSLFIGAVTRKNKTELISDECHTTLNVENLPVKFKVDTGAQVNILPLHVYTSLNTQAKLVKSETKLTSYSNNELCVKGTSHLKCNGRTTEFYIVETQQMPILGLTASQELGIIKIVLNINDTTECITKQHSKLFTGLGCLKTPYQIKLDTTVQPVVVPPRNPPAPLRERLKETLNEMETQGVIRRVDEPTLWVNSLVVVEKPKSKKLRVCLDPQHLNKAIQREHFQLPTLDDITTRLSGAQMFSKLDANHGYWQIPLTEDSQLLTTFSSPFGRYCFMRMPFGIKSAQEIFQKHISQLLGDLPGVETDIDDILVWGKSKEEHDQRLTAVLKRCEEINLTLNKDKCSMGVSEVTYIGHILNSKGIQPDPEKIRAIQDMPDPQDKKGVERLLGTVNYLAKFIPNMSTITKPMRDLLKIDVIFHWEADQKEAFKSIKQLLSTEPVLAFYNVNKPILITCDASQSGLGAVLLQEDRPIAYASRALTDAETRYAQIEKELLAIVFAFSKFHQYIYGKEALVESDHKPLESIMKKPLAAAPPRLQRMLLQLQKYSFTLVYKPGKEMVLADTLSRAFIDDPDCTTKSLEEELICAVNFVLNNAPISDPKLEEVRLATLQDPEMHQLKEVILSGWPSTRSQVPKEIQEYWNYRDEISEANDIILKGEKLVIPHSMRAEMLTKIHTCHLGIVKCKERARDILFWPRMAKDIEEVVSQCEICAEHRASNQREPMIMGEIPTRPWELVSTDLFKWNGDDYLLIVDSYSRFIEIAKLLDTSSSRVIHHTKSVFARHGIPTTVKSDNGPQYTSDEYKKFSTEWGFKHVTSSPYYPQANGLAEKSVQIIKHLLEKAKCDGKDPYISLLELRNTSVDNLGSPAQLSMNRRLKSILPTNPEQLAPKIIDPNKVITCLKHNQEIRKQYYDRGSKQLPPLKPNDPVRVQVQNQWIRATVVRLAETPNSYVVKCTNGSQLRRNRKHLIKDNTKRTMRTNPNSWDYDEANSTTKHQQEEPVSNNPLSLHGRTRRPPVRLGDYVRL